MTPKQFHLGVIFFHHEPSRPNPKSMKRKKRIVTPDSIAFFIDGVGLVATLSAIGFAVYTYKKQKISSDVEKIISVLEIVGNYWDKYKQEQSDEMRSYYIGQVLSYFENICFLINRKIIDRQAAMCVDAHIKDVWRALHSDPALAAIVEDLSDSPDTFLEIKTMIFSTVAEK